MNGFWVRYNFLISWRTMSVERMSRLLFLLERGCNFFLLSSYLDNLGR